MQEGIVMLAYWRSVVEDYASVLDDLEALLYRSSLGQRVIRAKRELAFARTSEDTADAWVRIQAELCYDNTEERHPHPAVEIKLYTTLDYNMGEALDYCRRHLPQALKLQKRTFEKVAKTITLDFVTTTKEPRVFIARDLEKWLKPLGEPK